MANYEYKVATPDNQKPFGAWLNGICIDGWRYKEYIPQESYVPGEGKPVAGFYIFEREKTIVKTPSKVTRKKKTTEKPE